MKWIHATSMEMVGVDYQDYDHLTLRKWGNDGNGYARSTEGDGVYMHRVIADRMGLTLSGRYIHHIDENPTNNQRSNLESMTPSEHMSLHMAQLGRNEDADMLRVIDEVMREDGTLTEMGKRLNLSQPMMSAIFAGNRHNRLHPEVQKLKAKHDWKLNRQRRQHN